MIVMENDPVENISCGTEKFFDFRPLLIVVNAFFAGYLLLPLAAAAAAGSDGRVHTLAAVGGPLLSIVFTAVMMRRIYGSWRCAADVLGLAEPLSYKFTAAALPLAVAVMLCGGGITLLWGMAAEAMGIVFKVPPTLDTVLNGGNLQLAALIVTALLAAPLFEEILFRRVIYESLKNFCGGRAALLVSSLAFAAVHLSLLQLPGLMFIAVVWQCIYIRRGNLRETVLLHFCNNFLALALLLTARFYGFIGM